MDTGRVLVIDDEEIICELLNDILKDKGYSVNYELSAENGIKAFQEDSFDVVMTDLKIAGSDGIDVLKQIKVHDPDSVVIVITGYPSFETVQTALRLGAYDYITKPFNLEEISFLIQRAIGYRVLSQTNKKLMKELEEQNARLEEKVLDRTRELTLLYKIGRDVSSSLKLDEALETIIDRLSKILNVEMCSILLVDKKTQELHIRAARGLANEVVTTTTIKLGELISGWIAQHKEAVLVEDIESDSRFTKRNQEKYYTRSFISVPLIVKDEVIGVINVNNKKSKEIFTKDDLRFVKGVANETAMAVENARLYTSLEDTYIRTVIALTSAIDAKDHYTRKHSENVTRYAVAIAREMGLADGQIENIRQASQLHDLGKIGVEDYILTKQGKLTDEEWEKIKQHSVMGAEILRPLIFLADVISLVEQHHERYDGKGYPFGLKEENISLGARIMAVADTFDAMTTDRPYRKAFSKDEAVQEIKKCSGTQFDPKVVEAFLKVAENLPLK